MVRIIVRTPKTRRVQRKRYVVITLKGIEFAEKWYTARARALVDHEDSVVNRASSRGYVNIDERPRRIPEAVHHKIGAMIGDAPRWIYA